MNTTPETPAESATEIEHDTVTPTEPVAAKPVRRRRTAKAATAETGTGEADSEAPPASEPTPAAAFDATAAAEPQPTSEPAPEKPKRTRRKAVAADAAAVQEAAPLEPSAEPAAPMAAEPAAAVPTSEHPAADVGEEPADEATTSEAAAAPEGDAGERAERGRRRGRRDRKRNARQESAAEGVDAAQDGGDNAPRLEADDDADGEGDSEDKAESSEPRPAPQKAEEVFAQLLAGSFDADVEEPPAEEVQTKRVLPPDPDAPKLQKVLAQAGIGSRRDMEQLILDGKILVNGEPAHVGQRISFGDRVKVDGKDVRLRITPPAPRILAYHKPVGEVVTHSDPENRPTVFRRLPRLPQGKWQSVGRLDINTEGLLLFTNSGELANQLMHPRFGVEREYAVRVLGTLTEDQREELLDGVDVDGQEASFRSIEDGGGEGANHWYRVVITEGRNREVRKLFDAIGLTVSRLIRIRYGSVVLPRGLKRGVWVDLDENDVRTIRRLTGHDQRPAGGAGPNPAGQGRNRNGKRGRNRGGNGGDRPMQDRPPQDRLPQDRPPQERLAQDRPPQDRDPDYDVDHGPIPNPLEQTFDRRFSQKRGIPSGFGAGGSAPYNGPGGGGFGGGGRGGNKQAKGGGTNGPRQPDPMQTSVGYIGHDAFHRKGGRGGGRGGGGGGFGGGFGGGSGNSGGGRRGR